MGRNGRGIQLLKRMSERVNIAKRVGRPSHLGRTLPSLLYAATATHPNSRAFCQREGNEWKCYSSAEFRDAAEELAVGLLDIGLRPGDRVALFQESDVYFCLADMGTLIAGLVNVPVYLTHTPDTIAHVLNHADVHAVIATAGDRFDELVEALASDTNVHTIILTAPAADVAHLGVPEGIRLLSLQDVRARGRALIQEDPRSVRTLSDRLEPSDLATIIYTSGTTGRPKGVMLTHENVSSNALMAYAGMTGYRNGMGGESKLSFLPLTHVFARTLYYGALSRGTSLYFSHPDRLIEDLASVKPTVVACVPRVLEKVYARLIARSRETSGIKGRIARWGLKRAQTGADGAAGGFVADRLVYTKWRNIFGGQLRWIISGGAALSAEIGGVFQRAGLTILEGYGLTETSPVIAFNRPEANRIGTVGTPLEGVEVRIAEDGEILTRGPHVMAGYFRDNEKTAEVIDDQGWFHTGDIGHLDPDGYLVITDRKKDLFKLSTGKYVMPQPLENKLAAEPLIDQCVVVGNGHKFAAALLFPNPEHIRSLAAYLGIPASMDLVSLCTDSRILERVQRLIDKANDGMSHWSTIKRFVMVPEELSIENGLLTPTLKVKRSEVSRRYADRITLLYRDENDDES